MDGNDMSVVVILHMTCLHAMGYLQPFQSFPHPLCLVISPHHESPFTFCSQSNHRSSPFLLPLVWMLLSSGDKWNRSSRTMVSNHHRRFQKFLLFSGLKGHFLLRTAKFVSSIEHACFLPGAEYSSFTLFYRVVFWYCNLPEYKHKTLANHKEQGYYYFQILQFHFQNIFYLDCISIAINLAERSLCYPNIYEGVTLIRFIRSLSLCVEVWTGFTHQIFQPPWCPTF